MQGIWDFLVEHLGPTEVLSPIYLACFCLIAFWLYLVRKEEGSFLAYLLPRDIWRHKSIRIDFAMLIINRLIAAVGITARLAAAPAVAAWVAQQMPRPLLAEDQLTPLMLALIVFLIGDFFLYWVHRSYHRIPTIWPLHAVHHSASVLTPVTTYRQHPVGSLITTALNTVVFGLLFGVIAGAYGPHLTFAEIAGANAFVFLANATMTNFQHSHIWISFGPVLERIFISPAQHQVHHSIERRHYNRNFGQTLAIWDWMFGTLYLIREKEEIRFGLTDDADAPLMTHRLDHMLIDPVRRMLRPSR